MTKKNKTDNSISDNRRFDGECQGCEEYTKVDDTGLCDECAAKLDRDLIRKREWEYSATAYAVPKEKLEKLRNRVIKSYGSDLELIAEDASSQKKFDPETRKQKKLKRKKSRQKTTAS